MAKRAKAPKKTKAAAPKAAEPFFRPFAELKGTKKKKKSAAAADGAPKAAPTATKAPTATRAPASRRSTMMDRQVTEPAPVKPVDPDTFAIYMAGVTELPGDRAQRIPRTASRVEKVSKDLLTPKEDPDADARARMRSLVTDGLRFETSDDGERLEGRRLDVDPREIRRLRKGAYAVDGKLDLHGLNAEEARQAVEAFIRKRADEGDVSIMIVHGRGSHSPRGHAVLRGEIAAWLSQGRAARHVQAFATAPDDLGGAGALLVLLAR